MAHDIKESDWKIFRQLSKVALERFCQCVLDDIERIASDTNKSSHERYLAIYRLTRERDESLAIAFNDQRRSTAFRKLMAIVSLDLLTTDELALFSQDMQNSIENCRDLF